jgi:hypothetical protein
MTEETNAQTSTAVESAPEPSTESLETIAKEIPVDEQAQQFTARPQSQPQTYQPQQPYIPDPITDQDGYRNFIAQQIANTTAVDSTLRELQGEIRSFKESQEKARLDQDVNGAVDRVNSKLKVDPMLAEIALEKVYRTDANFKKIWDNRHKNPQALEKALDVVANQLAPKFSVRQDPQLAENVRAARQSQSTMATTKQPSQNDGVPSDPAEFSRYWNRLISGT